MLSKIAYPFWNSAEKRMRALWRLVLQILLLMVCNIVSGLVLMSVWGLLGGNMDPAYVQQNEQSVYFYALDMLVICTAMVGSVWLAGKFVDRRPFADFGFHFRAAWWLDLGFGLALGALLMAGVFLVEWLAGWVTLSGYFHSNASSVTFQDGLLRSVVLFICVGIQEEIFSRGYQLRNIAEGLNFPVWGKRGALVLGWILSSLVFGLLHFGNPNASWISTFNIFVAGLFLGLGYLLTGELAIPIGIHITWNFFQGNVFGFPVSGTTTMMTFIRIEQGGPEFWTGASFGPEAGMIGLLAMLVGCALTVAWVRWRYQKVELQERLAKYIEY